MNVAHVPLQVGRDGERAVAVFAFVRLLARVGPQVARQIGRSRKDFAAKFARIPIPRFGQARAGQTDRVIGTGSGRCSVDIHQRVRVMMVVVRMMMRMVIMVMIRFR